MRLGYAWLTLAALSAISCGSSFQGTESSATDAAAVPAEGSIGASEGSSGAETSFREDASDIGDTSSHSPDGGRSEGGQGCDPAIAFDLERCPCTVASASRSCSFGMVGPLSACSAGLQTCTAGDAGALWGPCVGARMPSKEVCYDGVDNDCNGLADEGCKCGPTIDLCKGGDGAFVADDTIIFDPPDAVHIGATLEVYIVSRKSLDNTMLDINGNYCAGGGSIKACKSPGVGCAGWNVVRFEMTVNHPPFNANTFATLTFNAQAPTSGVCEGPRKIVGKIAILP